MSDYNPYDNYGGDYGGSVYTPYDTGYTTYSTPEPSNPTPTNTDVIGVTGTDVISNDVNNVGSTGVTTTNNVVTSPTVITQVDNKPRTFADLILQLQPTQPREINLPASPSITTLPSNDSGGGNSGLFIFLVVIGIGLTIWYARHKSL